MRKPLDESVEEMPEVRQYLTICLLLSLRKSLETPLFYRNLQAVN
jgi:hypothetical protein